MTQFVSHLTAVQLTSPEPPRPGTLDVVTFKTTVSLLLDCIDSYEDLDRSTAPVEKKVRLYNHLFSCKPLYISRL